MTQGSAYRPQVYLCYADADRDSAERLRKELDRRSVRLFSPQHDLMPGDQIVQMVEKHLVDSDFFLLLWSRACAGESWVRDQWHARLHKKRGFLFVLRLEDIEVPPLLAIRRRFDAFAGWDAAVDGLVTTWNRDRALMCPVMPAPASGAATRGDGRTITIYVRNRAMEVAHVVAVPPAATGDRLRALVRAELELKDEVTDVVGGPGGRLGLSFTYDLLVDGRPLTGAPLETLGIVDGSVVDLEITMRAITPSGEHTPVVFRREQDLARSGLSATARRILLRKAFGHLLPRRRR